jgi:hypothetical protein
MRNWVSLLVLTVAVPFIIASCKKDTMVNSYYGSGRFQIVSGNNQSGIYGEVLPKAITLKINSTRKSDKFYVVVKTTRGNGWVSIASSFQQLNAGDSISINWSLGCDYPDQQISCLLFSDSIVYPGAGASFYSQASDSISIGATGLKPSGWCKSCGFGNNLNYNSKIIADQNDNLYLINGKIFSSQDGGYNWYPLQNIPHTGEVADAAFNSKNELYIVTQNSGVFYSNDLNKWMPLNNGFIQPQSPTAFFIEDTALFVSYYFDGPYISTDNGNFWRKMLVGGNSQRYYYINRHPDGRLMLFDDWNTLKQSSDNGKTWNEISLDYKYANYSIYDFKIDKSGQLYIGSGDATLAILDPQSFQGTVHTYYQWNASLQTVNNITFAINDIYYLVNYSPTPGIYSEKNNWNILDIGFTDKISYFFKKSNGAFLLFSDNYIFYKN